MFWGMEEERFREAFKDKELNELSFEGKSGIGRLAGIRIKNMDEINRLPPCLLKGSRILSPISKA